MRLDHQHKLARMLVNRYGLIAVEGFNVKGLAGGMLSKQVLDRSWSSFNAKLIATSDVRLRKQKTRPASSNFFSVARILP